MTKASGTRKDNLSFTVDQDSFGGDDDDHFTGHLVDVLDASLRDFAALADQRTDARRSLRTRDHQILLAETWVSQSIERRLK